MSAIELVRRKEIQRIISEQVTNEFELLKTNGIDAKSATMITLYKSLIPNLDNTHSLGSSTNRYANLYTVSANVTTVSATTVNTTNLSTTNVTSNLIPNLDNTHSLGSAAKRYDILYTVSANVTTVSASTVHATNLSTTTVISNLIPNLDNTHSLGSSTNRYANLYTVNAFVGDITLDNDFRITEGDKVGFEKDTIAIKNDRNEVIAKLDKDGNLYIKGEIRKL